MSVVKERFEENEYGRIYCIACGSYNPSKGRQLRRGLLLPHYRRCPTAQLERILAI